MAFFSLPSVAEKLEALEPFVHRALFASIPVEAIPAFPTRTAQVVRNHELPPKPGLSRPEGQARLLHDLANIELQATELAVRTLVEYPDAPTDFREQLAAIALSEGRHLRMCVESLEAMGFQFGDWPIHIGLWVAVDRADDMIERILKVHRHMEGSGLDAGDAILRRLTGVTSPLARAAVETIVSEEVEHVSFGSHWFREICRRQGADADTEFKLRMPRIARFSPRNDRLAHGLRRAAGFSDSELEFLENLRVSSRPQI